MGPAFVLEIDKTEPMKVQFCLFPMQKLVPWRFSFVYFQCKSWSHEGSVLSISNAKAGPMASMGPAFVLEIDKTEPPWDQLLHWK
jgi:hypothetical protein